MPNINLKDVKATSKKSRPITANMPSNLSDLASFQDHSRTPNAYGNMQYQRTHFKRKGVSPGLQRISTAGPIRPVHMKEYGGGSAGKGKSSHTGGRKKLALDSDDIYLTRDKTSGRGGQSSNKDLEMRNKRIHSNAVASLTSMRKTLHSSSS